jgi:hypothetical protein
MRHAFVSRTIRRAVLLQLSMVAPGLAACGGGVVTEARGSGDAMAPQDAAVCAVTPTPLYYSGGSCQIYTFALNGSPAQCGADDAGAVPPSRCLVLCPPTEPNVTGPAVGCNIGAAYSGPDYWGPYVECLYMPCGTGRRPEGLRPCPPVRARRPAARFLARMAYLEAASVDAFLRLASELEGHGAPERLRSRALRAARDEVRHARVVTELANRAGARVPRRQVKERGARSLEAIALENAVEGCVHETFGAAVAMAQGETARQPPVRAAMRRIASDEARHAELSWAVAAWLDGRLTPGARARVKQAMARAGRALVDSTSRAPDPALVEELGLPTATQAHGIALALSAGLWEKAASQPNGPPG